VTVRDYRDSADRFFIRDDERDLDRYRDRTWERIDARGNEPRHRQHSFIAVVIGEARDVKIGWSRCGRGMT
jgi:hypothetical protein